MPPPVVVRSTLDPILQASVAALVARATGHDGVSPLNERATLRLTESGPHLVVVTDPSDPESDVVAYAQVDPADTTAQVVVAPAHRRHGLGRALVDRVAADHPDVRFWAFGDLPAARALAASTRRAVVRELLIMERSLADLPATEPSPGITIRPATAADAAAVVAVNAAAFAGHPEQGSMDRADFERRLDDPADVLLAVDSATGRVLGFHWTKRHDAADAADAASAFGEVYVIGVSPDAAGRGLGRTLLWAGLGQLAGQGLDRVILYVEGDNRPAVRLYETSGFRTVHRDVLYAPTAPPIEGDTP